MSTNTLHTGLHYDPEFDNSLGWLDAPDFAAHSVAVLEAIQSLCAKDVVPTVANIKREFPGHNERWLLDSIDALVGVGTIERMQRGSFSVYWPKDAPIAKNWGRSMTIGPPSSKSVPDWSELVK